MDAETPPNQVLRAVDVIAGLLNRERIDDAVEIQLDAITLALEWDMEILDVLELPVDDFIKLYTTPEQFTYPTVRGQWDTVIYGEAAFR